MHHITYWELINILHVPDFSCNLINTAQLTCDLDCLVTYYSNSYMIHDKTLKRMIGSSNLQEGDYVFKGEVNDDAFGITHSDNTIL